MNTRELKSKYKEIISEIQVTTSHYRKTTSIKYQCVSQQQLQYKGNTNEYKEVKQVNTRKFPIDYKIITSAYNGTTSKCKGSAYNIQGTKSKY